MRTLPLLTATCLSLALLGAPAVAADNPVPTKAEVEALIDQAQAWLLTKQQPDGMFGGEQFGLGVTALITDALAAQPHGLPATEEHLAKALALLKASQQPDGGIYTKEAGLGNYCTAITLMALASAGKLEEEKELVKKAQAYLFKGQVTEGKNAGGMGYDPEDGPGHEDVPNTIMAVLGLKASGIPSSDPHLQAAIKFLEHCQNLTSVNPAPWVDSSPAGIGSGVYTPNESQANGSFEEPGNKADPVKKLTGTGSMTYSLLSTYVALDLKQDDPRVSAALDWCKRNYRFDANPGMTEKHEHEGLLYYYVFLAKTMRTLGLKELELPGGRKVDWRADLFAAIKGHLVPGDPKHAMFANDAARWGETLPHLATAYMVKALKDIDAGL